MPRALPSLGSLALLAALVVLLITGLGEEDEPSSEPARVTATVVRIVDGDTVEARIEDEVETVRYIGVDTPESVKPDAPVECYALRASHFNERLVEGERVRLDFDAERRDVYGRLLAYVHVGDTFVNAELLRRGYATTLTIAPNDSHAARFARIEAAAAREGRGLWDACEV
ncbi:MAG TPA: thermonuclease family protein [Solirubrobacterales bacterium]|nr:thermonuclease family protein [Solirubrobacterales bacterium]